MKPFPIAICFHETIKKIHLHSLACFWFSGFCFVLGFRFHFLNVSDLLAPFQPLAPAVP